LSLRLSGITIWFSDIGVWWTDNENYIHRLSTATPETTNYIHLAA